MDTFNRFEIWYAELPALENSSVIRGRRPVILISNSGESYAEAGAAAGMSKSAAYYEKSLDADASHLAPYLVC